jgi:hypothetical protein
MSVASIRGIAKMLSRIRELDTADDPFEVEAEDDVPFVMLGHWVALSGVSPGALALYWMLAMHLNKTRGDRYVWPTTSILAHMIGYSRGDKIKRFVDELVAIGAVLVIPVPDGKGPQLRNTYKLRRNPPTGYEGPLALSDFYAKLNQAYEEETAGQPVSPETGVHVQPQTGGHVTPQTGGVTRRRLNKKNENKTDAPSARSAVDGRSPSTSGSSAREAESGVAASSKASSSVHQHDDTHRPAGGQKDGSKRAKHTREQLALVTAVRAYFPEHVLSGWTNPETGQVMEPLPELPVISDAILSALAGDVPGADRTAAQLGARVRRRWDHHGYAARFYAGTMDNLIGSVVAMVRPLKAGDQYGCANPRCEDGADVNTGGPCLICPERIADRRAERRQQKPQAPAGQPNTDATNRPDPTAPPVPAQRPTLTIEGHSGLLECANFMCGRPLTKGSTDSLCHKCRQEAEDLTAECSVPAPF